jgi:CRISPR-associated protein Cas1
MIKNTIAVTRSFHISYKRKQLILTNKETGEEHSRTLEDLGCVIFEHPQITFTQQAMQGFAEHNVSVIFCDGKYHPTSMLLNLDSHYIQTERFKFQIDSTEPLRKNLWQQVIKAKLWNQGKLLEILGKNGEPLYHLSKQVKSGDSENKEAWGAKIYWNTLFGDDFSRERFGDMPNPALNYGYAILRACVARNLAGSGLLPTLGIHHRNRYNSYCLADDIMEPYRPFVDWMVWEMREELMANEEGELSQAQRHKLLEILTIDVIMEGKKRPLMNAVKTTTAKLAQCFEGTRKKMLYAQLQ